MRESSTLPPLILLPGQRPSQEQKALALRHLLISTPISETMSSTLSTLSPTTWVRSIPQMRSKRPASSILGSLPIGLRFLFAFLGGLPALVGSLHGKLSCCCAPPCFKRIEFQLGRGGFDLLGQFFQEWFHFTVAFFDARLVEAISLQALA